jgi:hypothetical protein
MQARRRFTIIEFTIITLGLALAAYALYAGMR